MTSEQIAELRALEREATEGPWSWRGGGLGPSFGEHRNEYVLWPSNAMDPESEYGSLSPENHQRWWTARLGSCGRHAEPAAPSNALLLVAARNALPRLLDEREALLKALKGVEWGGDSFQGFAAVCPECVASEGKPHEPDCALAAAIAKAEAP